MNERMSNFKFYIVQADRKMNERMGNFKFYIDQTERKIEERMRDLITQS